MTISSKEEKVPLATLESQIAVLNKKLISPMVNFWDCRDNFEGISKIQNEMLKLASLNYDYHTRLIETDDQTEEFFSWKNNFIKIWSIGVKSPRINTRDILFFATTSEQDEIETLDLVEETSNPTFYKLTEVGKIDFLIQKKLIPDISASIIKTSINGYSFINAWVESWVSKELESIDQLASPSQELFDFNKAIIRAKRYNFEEMLHTINNEQFTMEFDECLYAYNNQKWFVCAAGLGGVLEHLLYLILEKNQMMDTTFPDDATAKIYIEYLSRTPIKIKKREKTYIRTLFLTRNSISHFNQGFASKDQCTQLMNGIKNVFNNYYVKDFSLDDN